MHFTKSILLVSSFLFSFALMAQAPALLASAEGVTLVEPIITPAAPFTAASYPGGQAALEEQLRTNVVYPQLAQDYAIEGTVVVRLSLNENGKIVKREVVRGLGFGCDEAALSALAQMPNWNAARRGSKQVSGFVYVPLRFQLR